MKVGELIKQLRKFPKNKPVRFWNYYSSVRFEVHSFQWDDREVDIDGEVYGDCLDIMLAVKQGKKEKN